MFKTCAATDYLFNYEKVREIHPLELVDPSNARVNLCQFVLFDSRSSDRFEYCMATSLIGACTRP